MRIRTLFRLFVPMNDLPVYTGISQSSQKFSCMGKLMLFRKFRNFRYICSCFFIGHFPVPLPPVASIHETPLSALPVPGLSISLPSWYSYSQDVRKTVLLDPTWLTVMKSPFSSVVSESSILVLFKNLLCCRSPLTYTLLFFVKFCPYRLYPSSSFGTRSVSSTSLTPICICPSVIGGLPL